MTNTPEQLPDATEDSVLSDPEAAQLAHGTAAGAMTEEPSDGEHDEGGEA